MLSGAAALALVATGRSGARPGCHYGGNGRDRGMGSVAGLRLLLDRLRRGPSGDSLQYKFRRDPHDSYHHYEQHQEPERCPDAYRR